MIVVAGRIGLGLVHHAGIDHAFGANSPICAATFLASAIGAASRAFHNASPEIFETGAAHAVPFSGDEERKFCMPPTLTLG
jgi:hypothetical protein